MPNPDFYEWQREIERHALADLHYLQSLCVLYLPTNRLLTQS